MTTLLASDVHLSAARPDMVERFLTLLGGPARRCDALYLLGDVFDLWLGDDDDRAPHDAVCSALAELTASGVPVHVAHGNHDFLLGEAFAARTGCTLLPDSATVEIAGEPVLVMHGDQLCTRDVDYQAFRRHSRDPRAQQAFLARPLAERLEAASALRVQSQAASRLKADDIMDVTPDAVVAALRAADVRVLVHGHTHRPGFHRLPELGPEPGTRIVLGDWYATDSVLAWDAAGPRLTCIAELTG
ncbi:MAG: UDP-2,3-diacylglucosamine diphosphatase [Chromatiales bacterium]|nr:UDP-2,3-diacylglucosamine diphosphatase [Chromatiales bacterium]